jgi:hypothetical protein
MEIVYKLERKNYREEHYDVEIGKEKRASTKGNMKSMRVCVQPSTSYGCTKNTNAEAKLLANGQI